MDDNELIERYLRGELSDDEIKAFNEKLATDNSFKELFEVESVIFKSLQYSIEKERIKKLAEANVAEPKINYAWLKGYNLWHVGATALAVWIVSNLTFSTLHVDDRFVKWIGLTLALVFSCASLIFIEKKFDYHLIRTAMVNSLFIFVISSGIDAINQGIEVRSKASKSVLIPFTEQAVWWPTKSLADRVESLVDSVAEQKIIIVGQERSNLELSAQKNKLEITVDSLRSIIPSATPSSTDDAGAAIVAQQFDVKNAPDPHYEVYVENILVDLSKGIRANQVGALVIVAEPEANFKKEFPKDARYKIKGVEIVLIRGTANILTKYATSGSPYLSAWAAQARPGDLISIDIKKVVRINYRDQEEHVEVVGSAGIIYIPIY